MLPNKNILYKTDNPMDGLVITLLQTLVSTVDKLSQKIDLISPGISHSCILKHIILNH